MTDEKDVLKRRMTDIATRCKLAKVPDDWGFELYRLIEIGFHTFFKYKREGMRREDVTALQRASRKAGGWMVKGVFVTIEEMQPAYQDWKRLQE
jgi:predicted acetyltransferase